MRLTADLEPIEVVPAVDRLIDQRAAASLLFGFGDRLATLLLAS